MALTERGGRVVSVGGVAEGVNGPVVPEKFERWLDRMVFDPDYDTNRDLRRRFRVHIAELTSHYAERGDEIVRLRSQVGRLQGAVRSGSCAGLADNDLDPLDGEGDR